VSAEARDADLLCHLALAADGDGYQWEVPTGFAQGKATFGGLVMAALAAAAGQRAPAGRKLRSVQAELMGAPRPGPSTLTVRSLRESRHTTTLAVELTQGGEVTTHAVFLFADARAALTPIRPPAIAAEPWHALRPLPIGMPFAPEFTQHFEYRVVDGMIFSGTPAGRTHGWLRPRRPPASGDDRLLMLLVDAWWVAALVALDRPRPAATVQFALDVHGDFTGIGPAGPYYHRGEVVAQSDGWASETRELWGPDGRLLALNRQLVAVI